MKATSASGIRGRFAFISLLALLAGGAIYLFLRPGEFVFHNWLSVVGLEGLFFPNVSVSTPSAGKLIPAWILYSLPNGLWVFANTLLRSALGLGTDPGNFSFTDILLSACGMVSGGYTTNR